MTEQELREQFDLSLKYLDEHCTCDQEVGYVCPECNIFKAIKLAQETIKAKDAEIERLKSTFAGYENFQMEKQLKQELQKTREQLEKAEDILTSLDLSETHADFCFFKMGDDCKCMDRKYYNSENLAKLARQYIKDKQGE